MGQYASLKVADRRIVSRQLRPSMRSSGRAVNRLPVVLSRRTAQL